MHPVVRVLAVAAIAAIGLTCSEQSATGLRRAGRLAYLAINPVFAQGPSGGPDIDVEKIKGVLKRLNGSDSVVAEAMVEGDSAILEFSNVSVSGDSTSYRLGVTALDSNGVVVFQGSQDIKVKPGENSPASPQLNYSAPDMTATSIDIQAGTQSVSNVALSWAGALLNDQTCLNRANPGSATAQTKQQLSIVGKTAANVVVPNVHVGWTSRDAKVATVTDGGLVSAQCSNRFTYVVARTFLDVVDSVKIDVTAPAFSLLMDPDSTSLARGATRQLTALVVDENGNQVPAAQVTWSTSDATRATVGTTGVVQALRNGRVLITASSGNRTTIGIVQVVRPTAVSVKVIPQRDTVVFGQVRQYFAKAFDALGQVIGDAREFQWASTNASVATINATSGILTAQQTADSTFISAAIDGKTNSATVRAVASLPPGSIRSIVRNGSTDAPISGATISVPGGTTTSAADGSFTLGGVKAGDDITITVPTVVGNFVPVTFYSAPAFPNQTIQVPGIPLSPTSGANGTMNGKVVNVLSANGVSGITVSAYAGLNAAPSVKRPNVQPVVSATTASDGTFSMSAAAGAYTFVASGTGYSEGVGVGISIGGATRTTPNILLPPNAPGGGLYAVLTWATAGTNVPADLDLYVTGPTNAADTARFKVFSGATSFVLANGDTIAALDVSRTTGPGPEVIGLRPSAAPGFYNFYVHNVSGVGAPAGRALADSSGARVDVFQDNRIIATFFPQAGQQGTLWQAFKYDGSRIFPGGGVIQTTNPPTVTLRAIEPVAAARNPTKPRRQ